MSWDLFRLRQKNRPTTKRARNTKAPTTPPAIAPTFVCFVLLDGGTIIVWFARLGYSSISNQLWFVARVCFTYLSDRIANIAP